MRKKNPIDALFPKIRQNILAATYSQPEKWWFMSELAGFIKTTPSSLQRELDSLAVSGILRRRRDGNRLYFQAETDSPIFAPLSELVTQTLGITTELKESLAPLAEKIRSAFVYGSVARSEERATSDVDLMVVGAAALSELSPILRRLERRFSREINATCYGTEEFKKKIQSENHFLMNVLKKEKLFLIGDENELDEIAGKPDSAKPHYQSTGNRKPA